MIRSKITLYQHPWSLNNYLRIKSKKIVWNSSILTWKENRATWGSHNCSFSCYLWTKRINNNKRKRRRNCVLAVDISLMFEMACAPLLNSFLNTAVWEHIILCLILWVMYVLLGHWIEIYSYMVIKNHWNCLQTLHTWSEAVAV